MTTNLPVSSTNFRQASTSNDTQILGRTEPRLLTPPLREDLFTNPQASYGHKVIRFARDVLKHPLDPWQEHLVIRMGELLPDGKTPRFRQVLVIVARQNGKTELLKVLSLYWMIVEKWPEVMATNSSLTYAKEAMLETAALAQKVPVLASLVVKPKEGNNDISFSTTYGTKYRAKAATRKAGRGKSLDRVIVDELREHTDWNTYNAAIPAMSAKPFAQAVFITNAGDEGSVVLDSLRASALEFINTGSGDERLGLFEWSAPEGLDFTDFADPEMWRYANPNLGRRLPFSTLKSAAMLAATGPKEEADFRTEHLSQKVSSLNPAVDSGKWAKCFLDEDLSDYRDNLSLCIDVSMDRHHATLVAASVTTDDNVRVEFLREWSGADLLKQVTNDLPSLIDKYQPKVFGWLPNGPATALATSLQARKQNRPDWARGVRIEEISGEVTAACEGLAAEVASLTLEHNNNPLLSAQITGAEKLPRGDRWIFTRQGKGHVDAAYATAGSVYLARTMPPEPVIAFFNFTPST